MSYSTTAGTVKRSEAMRLQRCKKGEIRMEDGTATLFHAEKASKRKKNELVWSRDKGKRERRTSEIRRHKKG